MENQKINEFIRKELNLSDNITTNIAILTKKFNEIKECENQLERMRKEYCSELLKEWSGRLAEDFPNCNRYDVCSDKRMSTGIVLPYKDIEKAIYINLEFIDKKVCCGVTYMPETQKMREEIQSIDLIRPFWESKEFYKGVDWLFYKYIDLEGAYDSLKGLIKRML